MTDTTGARPVPTPTQLSRPHWDACRRRELTFQRCDACRQAVFPPSPACWRCGGASLTWEQSAGTGSVYSHSTVWRPQTPAFDAPYSVAVVAVDEGWHLFTNVVGCHPDEVHTGLRVRVSFVEAGDPAGTVLPAFTPDREGEVAR